MTDNWDVDRVVVGGQSTAAYHYPADAEAARPEPICTVTSPRGWRWRDADRARDGDRRRCRKCDVALSGEHPEAAAGPAETCPLCGVEVGSLSQHLGTPKGEGCPATPDPPERGPPVGDPEEVTRRA